MWEAWGRTTLAILGGMATVAAVAAILGFYPIGLIVLLAAALVAALQVAISASRRSPDVAAAGPPPPDPAAREHDANIVSEIRNLVTRDNVEWLRQWDFGGSWRDEWIHPFKELERLDDVEHRPLDAEVAAALRKLFDANVALLVLMTQHAFVEPNQVYERWWNVGWSGGEAETLDQRRRKVWEERRDLLNEAAGSVVDAYDDFIDTARQKLLLDPAKRAVSDSAI